MLKQQVTMAGLLCRLSRDDGGDAESNSITTQRQMLRRYAKEQGFQVYDEYIDDGISGTTMDRPGFKRMINDIEDGKIGIVLCKDLSRLGRNNALVAYYTELYFPDNDVRFIAIGDGIDTFKGDNEIMAFKSVVNEYYARDISRKIRSAKRTKHLNGEFTGAVAPYGYRKNPEDRHRLIVDENVAHIVKRIFEMAADGFSPNKIAVTLTSEGIPTPGAYNADQSGKENAHRPKYPEWSRTTIMQTLHNRVYLGHFEGGKHSTKSFKNKKVLCLPTEQWIVVENTHEPIIDQYLFDLAQKVAHVKKRENKSGRVNIFAGLLKCSTCGKGLGLMPPRYEGHLGYYICNLFRNHSKQCTGHSISYKDLYTLVLNDIKNNAAIARQFEGELAEYARKVTNGNDSEKYRQTQKDIEKARQRCSELDLIIKKLLEQNALGVISDERFCVMTSGYEKEQKDLAARLAVSQAQLDKKDTDGSNAVKFLNAIRKYSDITELDAKILNDLIDSIVVYDPEKKWAKASRVQKVDINYKFIGLLRMDECQSA